MGTIVRGGFKIHLESGFTESFLYLVVFPQPVPYLKILLRKSFTYFLVG